MKRRKAIKICFHSAAYAGIFAMVGNSLSSCTTDHVYELSFEFFDEEKGKILSIISDLMIPESDTPGAIDVGVPYSIDRYVANFLPEKNQMELVNGLGMIDKLSLQLFSNKFTELSTKEMSQTLAYLSQDAAKVKDQSTHLFRFCCLQCSSHRPNTIGH